MVPSIHELAVTADVLIPEMPATRGVSTVARIDNPSGVRRISAVRPAATTAAPTRTTSWFALIATPKTSNTRGSPSISPSGSKISLLVNGNTTFTKAGSATQRPTVETNRTTGGVCARRRNSAAQRNRPSAGDTSPIETNAAAGTDQPWRVWSQ
jgi:hypothetical protein